jgi:tripartite-type tricarboxylate transporter receptor subunit TctC
MACSTDIELLIMLRRSIGHFSALVRQISSVLRDLEIGLQQSRPLCRSRDTIEPALWSKSMTTPKSARRTFLRLAAGAIALPLSRIAWAQGYPTRPVRIVAGYAPGGGVDIVARLIGHWLSERLGQSFIVENRPGAASNIATEYVIRSPADGYTLQLIDSTGAINATLYDNLNFNFIRDMAPVAGIMSVPNIMLLHPSVPAQTVPEFISYVRANPGKINVASAGTGTSPHLSAELFKMMTGVNIVHVPYRGMAPALNDLLGGQVQSSFATASASIQYVLAGKLKALAVTTTSRSEALPDVPALAEFVPGYEATTWYGIGAPRNTPIEIVDTLNKEVNAALDDPTMRARFTNLAGKVLPGSSANLGKFIADETEKWAKVVKFSGAKPG